MCRYKGIYPDSIFPVCGYFSRCPTTLSCLNAKKGAWMKRPKGENDTSSCPVCARWCSVCWGQDSTVSCDFIYELEQRNQAAYCLYWGQGLTSLSKALKIISEAPKCVGLTGSKENIDSWINLIKSEPKFVGYSSICIIYMVCVSLYMCVCAQKKDFILYLLTSI